MTTISASHGTDTWARSDHPNRNLAGGNAVRLQSASRRGFVHVPVTDIRGRTVLAATLTGHAKGSVAAQTVTCAAIVDSWSAGRLTWNRQPAVGASVATVIAAAADGEAVDLDVTALIQAVANGTRWRGLRLTTNDATADHSNWYAFDAAKPSWTLTVELSDVPEQPSDLRPNGGAVASGEPILAWSYTDLGGDSSEQGAFKVQVDPDADEISPAFDSGWVTSADPQYDLSSGAFAALSSGDDTQWRVMTRDAAGNESEWSDWATFSYEPNPTLTMDSPTGGVIGDSTPDILAHLTGETLTQWRAIVTDTAGTELWNSGLQDGAISITVPTRNDAGRRIIRRDDTDYLIRVRAWGDVDRADAVGLPAYVEQTVTVTFDEDAGVTEPSNLTVEPVDAGDPRLLFTWERDEAADAWLILAGGDIVARLDPDDVEVDAGVYTWTDGGISQPYDANDWTVRAVEAGVRSVASNEVTVTTKPEGIWIIPEDDDPIRLSGGTGAVDQFATTDRRASYSPPTSDSDIDIVYALEGVSGRVSALLLSGTDQSVAAAVRRLRSLREDVAARPRLVWATRSIRVLLRNVTALPSGEFLDVNRQHGVSFDFIEIGD